MEPVNVICIKWGSKYGADYVNTLRNMVARHLSRPHRFICLTEHPEGIQADIETKPIPPTGFPAFDRLEPWVKGDGWLKLSCFVNPLYDIKGKTLFLDLDVVITDSLDALFDFNENFVVIKDWAYQNGVGNTSVFLFEAGAQADVLDHFTAHHEQIRKDIRIEQEYISLYMMEHKTITYWPQPWCVSYKYHCMGRGLKSWYT
uniref:glycosyltransferase n=1 Tax=Hydrogenophaga sp. TaxID=1904254 RepID=UPI003566C2E3